MSFLPTLPDEISALSVLVIVACLTWTLSCLLVELYVYLYNRLRLRNLTDSNSSVMEHPRQQDIELGMANTNTNTRRLPPQQCRGTVAVQVNSSKEFSWRDNVPYCYNDECAICLESFSDGILSRVLTACNHVYHKDCIDEWLSKGEYCCPICRNPTFALISSI